MNKNILFVIALISITLFSCQKENELTSLSNSSNEINEESLSSEFDENHYLTSLAQILNNAAMQDINETGRAHV